MAGSYGVGAAASLSVDLRKRPEQAVRASFALASGWLALSELSIARCEMTFLVWIHTGFSHPFAHRFLRGASDNISAQSAIRRLRFAGQVGEGIGEALAAIRIDPLPASACSSGQCALPRKSTRRFG